MILIVFTKSYPYDFAPEYTFLHREISYLAEKFDKVVLVPKVCSGNRFDVPSGVEVDESLAGFIRKNSSVFRSAMNVLNSKTIYQELRIHPYCFFPPNF